MPETIIYQNNQKGPKKSKMKIVGSVLYWTVLVVLLLIAGLTAISALDLPKSYKLLVVESGSMEKAIHTGSVVIVRPTDSYQKGDVITYTSAQNPRETITHRIQEVKTDNNVTTYITKGDANDVADTTPVSPKQVVGRVFFSVPLVGYIIAFAKTLPGLIILIIIPAVIIVYSEVLNIIKELKRLFFRMKKVDEEVEKIEKDFNAMKTVEEKMEKEVEKIESKLEEQKEDNKKKVRYVKPLKEPAVAAVSSKKKK